MKTHKEWVRITHCENIPLREGRALRIGDLDIAIFNLGDRFLAVDNHCPHKGGPLADGIVAGSTVVCPLHGWKFDLESGEVRKPAQAAACVRSYRTMIDGGVILIEIPQSLEIVCHSEAALLAAKEVNA